MEQLRNFFAVLGLVLTGAVWAMMAYVALGPLGERGTVTTMTLLVAGVGFALGWFLMRWVRRSYRNAALRQQKLRIVRRGEE